MKILAAIYCNCNVHCKAFLGGQKNGFHTPLLNSCCAWELSGSEYIQYISGWTREMKYKVDIIFFLAGIIQLL